MLELNLFSPPGYTVEDKLSLMEPIWDSGLAKVGQAGARGWGEELHDRIAKGNREMEEGEERREVWQEEVLARGLGQGACWLQLEVSTAHQSFTAHTTHPEHTANLHTSCSHTAHTLHVRSVQRCVPNIIRN